MNGDGINHDFRPFFLKPRAFIHFPIAGIDRIFSVFFECARLLIHRVRVQNNSYLPIKVNAIKLDTPKKVNKLHQRCLDEITTPTQFSV